MYDCRLIMSAIHRYGEACRSNDHARAGVLYSELVRMIDEHDESAPPGPKTERGVTLLKSA